MNSFSQRQESFVAACIAALPQWTNFPHHQPHCFNQLLYLSYCRGTVLPPLPPLYFPAVHLLLGLTHWPHHTSSAAAAPPVLLSTTPLLAAIKKCGWVGGCSVVSALSSHRCPDRAHSSGRLLWISSGPGPSGASGYGSVATDRWRPHA